MLLTLVAQLDDSLDTGLSKAVAAVFIVSAVVAVLIATIPASIARNKGRSFWLWYLYGLVLFIVALIHALLLPELGTRPGDPGTRQCPFCAETIKRAAMVCRYCGRDLPALEAEPTSAAGPLHPSYRSHLFFTPIKVCRDCGHFHSLVARRCRNCGGSLALTWE